MSANVGIRGLGVYLPPEVRRNDWWAEHVGRWMDERRAAARPLPEARTEGERRVLEQLAIQVRDPFQGSEERHVMPDEMSVLDMEEHAARAAIARAAVDPRDIDLVLTNTIVPDFLLGNPAAMLHERLGLQKACFSLHSDVVSYTFMMQLQLAEAMIAAGRARCALIVQSCTPSRLVPATDAIAPFFGDAATAAVVGRVSEGRGLEAAVHRTDGRYARYLIASVPGGRWYDDGRAVLHIAEPQKTQRVFLETADVWKECMEALLAQAARAREDIDFFCVHQGARWVRPVVQEYLGLTAARSVDTFSRTGHVFASAQPLGLARAEEQGLLRPDDLVLLVGGGSGITYGASLIRWGA
jgi:3-oxoacyl-[acyl-carrier-protein] synthase-3